MYFFIHALTTYRCLHDMYSATFKRKPSEGVGHDLTNHTSLSSRFIAYSGSIRRESGRGFHIRPRTMCAGFRDTKRAPGMPGHVPTASQPTPPVSAAHGLQHTTNTRNYLQLLDRGQGWLRSREGPLVLGPMHGSSCSWITNTELSS